MTRGAVPRDEPDDSGSPPDARPDPLWSRAPLPHRAELAVLGRSLVVRSNDRALVDAATEAFGRFELPDRTKPGLALELVAPVAGDAIDPGSAGSVWASADALGARAPIHRERGHLFVASDGAGSLVVADLREGVGHAFVAAGAAPEAVRAVLLEATAYRFVTRQGMIALHAAAIVARGTTLVLRGAGGAGKSTLAYAAARAGHGVLADEVVWHDPAGGCLRGTPWWLRLEADSASLFPELADVPLRPRAQGGPKRVVDAGARGLVALERAPLGPIVLLQPRAPRTTWRRIGADEALAAFLASAIPGEHAQDAAAMRRAVLALAERGAFALAVGRPEEGVASLEAIADAARSVGG